MTDPAERRQDQRALLEVAEGLRAAAQGMGDSVRELSKALTSDRSARRLTMIVLLVVGILSAVALYRTEHNANVASCRSKYAVELDVARTTYTRDIGNGQDLQNQLLAAGSVSADLEAQLRAGLKDNLVAKDRDGKVSDAAAERRAHTADLCK